MFPKGNNLDQVFQEIELVLGQQASDLWGLWPKCDAQSEFWVKDSMSPKQTSCVPEMPGDQGMLHARPALVLFGLPFFLRGCVVHTSKYVCMYIYHEVI